MTNNRTAYLRSYRQRYKGQAKRVGLTLTMPEYQALSTRAEEAGQPLAAHVKDRVLSLLSESEPEPRLPQSIEDSLRDLSRQVRGIANNVNQMARHSHTMAHVLDEVEVFYRIKDLEEALRTAIAKILSMDPKEQGSDNHDTL